jgi:3-methyl-2-oxobutanoate hydroxymethyltransferase
MNVGRRLPTVADLQALKGQKQLTMLRYFSIEEAAAAEAAGIDIASVPEHVLFDTRYRDNAPSIFSMTGQTHTECGSPDMYLRWCNAALEKGADALYCSGSLKTVEKLAREYIPIVGHVGLVPSRATFTGGFRAVGKTAESALRLFQEVKAYEAAGAIAVELEVVPDIVAAEISKRVNILVWSMGAGADCDAQYLFSSDILGLTEGNIPRHSKVYRDFKLEYARLQQERIAAFREFVDDVNSRKFPERKHLVDMPENEFSAFCDLLARETPAL